MLQKDGNVARKDAGEMPNVLFFKNRITEDILRRALNVVKEKLKNATSVETVNIAGIEVAHERIDELARRLKDVEMYYEAEQIITEMDLPVMETLHHLGYRIVWKGLEPYRIKKSR